MLTVNIIKPEGGAAIKGSFPCAARAISDVPLRKASVCFGCSGNIEIHPDFPAEFELGGGGEFATTFRPIGDDEYAEGTISLTVVGEELDGSTAIGSDFVMLRPLLGVDVVALSQAMTDMVDERIGTKGTQITIKVVPR